mmetsp:Transcript_39792/g.65980  ORF Transcript_39792/g.65980 Transcript_39792/m.65980 type:complete len:103 (-) Transcript_39792:693-1001(-)
MAHPHDCHHYKKIRHVYLCGVRGERAWMALSEAVLEQVILAYFGSFRFERAAVSKFSASAAREVDVEHGREDKQRKNPDELPMQFFEKRAKVEMGCLSERLI